MTWVGVNDRKEEGKFVGVDNESTIDLPWRLNWPDNYAGNEHCVGAVPHKKDVFRGYTDFNCEILMRVGCEKVETNETEKNDEIERKLNKNFDYVGSWSKIIWYSSRAKIAIVFYLSESKGKIRSFFTTKYLEDSWKDAQNECKKLKMNLATFDSSKEAKYFSQKGGAEVWVGINDIRKKGKYVKVTDGKNFNIYNFPWADGEPNNYKNRENCVQTGSRTGYWYSELGFKDNDCRLKYKYACEKIQNTNDNIVYDEEYEIPKVRKDSDEDLSMSTSDYWSFKFEK